MVTQEVFLLHLAKVPPGVRLRQAFDQRDYGIVDWASFRLGGSASARPDAGTIVGRCQVHQSVLAQGRVRRRVNAASTARSAQLAVGTGWRAQNAN